MSAHRYGEYAKDVSGWFLGMTGTQLALVTLAGVPALLALNAPGLGAVRRLAAGVGAAGRGSAGAHPGPCRRPLVRRPLSARDRRSDGLDGVRLTSRRGDGRRPVRGRPAGGARRHPHPRRAALRAAVHPAGDRAELRGTHLGGGGVGSPIPASGSPRPGERDRMGAGLAELCEIAARTELVDVLALQVRTVPDDGAERAAWERAHARPDAPTLAARVNALLGATLTPAAVRTEAFVTVVVGEGRIARAARESGGGRGRPRPGPARGDGRGRGRAAWPGRLHRRCPGWTPHSWPPRCAPASPRATVASWSPPTWRPPPASSWRPGCRWPPPGPTRGARRGAALRCTTRGRR